MVPVEEPIKQTQIRATSGKPDITIFQSGKTHSLAGTVNNTAAAAAAKALQSCPTLCHPIDGSPPGSRVPGILQARTWEWGAIAFSRITQQTCLKVVQHRAHIMY